MKKNFFYKYIGYCLLFFHLSVSGQTSGLFLYSDLGYGVNPVLDINGQQTNDNHGLLFDLGAHYGFMLRGNLYAEAGLAGRLILASGNVGHLSFRAQTLRMQLPLKVGYRITPSWAVALGVTIQNNKDVLKSDFREPYFWRANLLLEGKYFWTDRWFLKLSLNYEGRNVPAGYLLNDPKAGILAGLGWRL